MAKEIIYRNLDFLVTQENGVVSLQKRCVGAVIIGLIALALALLGWWLRGMLDSSSAYAMLLTFFCSIFAFCAILLLLFAPTVTLVSKRGYYRFDPLHGIATLGREECPIQSLTTPYIKSVTTGTTNIDSLMLQYNGKELTLLTAMKAGALEPVQQALARTLEAGGAARQVNPPVEPSGTWPKFMLAFLLLFGSLWSGVGYLTMRDVVIVSIWDRKGDGVLLWPLGIWIVVPGLLEGFSQWQGQSFFAKNPKLVQFTLVAGIISYLIVCSR
jgi:hypothetical protein